MKPPIQVLCCEDSEDDFELLVLELRRGFDVVPRRVDSPDAMRTALAEWTWDIVISDFSMPSFSAMQALQVLQQSELDIPFIIVSGTISEDIAIDALKAGAHDFMLKDRLARLVPAVQRELRDAENRREHKRVQAQLLVADRMVAVGSLAAGVAHEINNPLAALMANIDLAVKDLQDLEGGEEQRKEAIQRIREQLADAQLASARVRDIVRDLKVFSRSENERRGPVDVERVMDSTLRMAWNEIRHRAKLVKNYGSVPLVEANESRLGQIFLNLVVNAAQAIPDGQADRNEIRVTTRAENGKRVVVEVTDTGPGIPPDVLKRLFTPFVTTKPVGVGTGLGLSICHRLVTELGGRIDVETAVGSGTTFRVSLPVATEAADVARPEAPKPATATPARRGRILVIDDEPLIAKAVTRALTAHDVVARTRAREALDLIAAGEHFDVILCDLMMPEMTGMDFHAELGAAHPQLLTRVWFLSGGAFSERAREFLDSLGDRFLEKPFDPERLRAFIAERLPR